MNMHQNAGLTPLGRERLVRLIDRGHCFARAGQACGVSAKTAAKWYRRFEAEGVIGLQDRSSRPTWLRRPTPDAIRDRIIALRRQRLTGAHIAAKTGVSAATVSRVLRRAGLNRLRDLEPAEPVRRYERDHPGDLIHLDIKRLGRFEQTGHRITGDPQKGKSRGAGLTEIPAFPSSHVPLQTLAATHRNHHRTRRRRAVLVAYLVGQAHQNSASTINNVSV